MQPNSHTAPNGSNFPSSAAWLKLEQKPDLTTNASSPPFILIINDLCGPLCCMLSSLREVHVQGCRLLGGERPSLTLGSRPFWPPPRWLRGRPPPRWTQCGGVTERPSGQGIGNCSEWRRGVARSAGTEDYEGFGGRGGVCWISGRCSINLSIISSVSAASTLELSNP